MRSLKLGSLMGIEIHLDASLIIIFALLVWLLGGEVFPGWHPDWSAGLSWITGFAAGILFFVSLLLHELAHSMVARNFGISVPRITLFLFGGIAEIEDEPNAPKTEFFIAIAGPVTSLLLGVIFSLLASNLAGPEFAEALLEDQKAALAELAPLPTLLFWLGPINIVLGLFNLVPGFPLDGGRVLRAALWWMTGDLDRATRSASEAGRLFGWFLMALGLYQALSGAFVQGLWLLLIGWFLANAATTSYTQLVMRRKFEGYSVRDLMRSHFEITKVDLSVPEFVHGHLLQSAQILWPVLEEDRLVGFATLEEVKRFSPNEYAKLRVRDIMRTDLEDFTIPPEMSAMAAMRVLSTHSTPLAVVEDNEIVGLLSQADAVKWLALHQFS